MIEEPIQPNAASSRKLRDSTVALLREDLFGLGFDVFCSGVWISRDVFVTAAHCASGEKGTFAQYATFYDLYDSGGERERTGPESRLASLEKVEVGYDLAAYRAVEAPAHEVATFSARAPRVGDFVQTMGHPAGVWWWSYSTGTVAAVRYKRILKQEITWVQSTAPMSPGNSGGGLFDDRGQLIGIASNQTLPPGQNLNFYVHVKYVAGFASGIRGVKQ